MQTKEKVMNNVLDVFKQMEILPKKGRKMNMFSYYFKIRLMHKGLQIFQTEISKFTTLVI